MPRSTFAVFSDVHGNLEALEAVLAEMDARNIKTRVCLGDTVGYGPNPSKCLERVRALKGPILRGNHDEAAAGDEELLDMVGPAQDGILFARKRLSAEQRNFLAELPHVARAKGVEFVHSSLAAPEEWHYVMTIWDAQDHFAAQVEPLCFCGHTHVPSVWHLGEEGELTMHAGVGRVPLPKGGKVLVNVGSVGQPRDREPDACYVVCTPDAIEFCRVPYDIAKTRRKIMRAKLPPYLGQRLVSGT